MRSLRCDFRVCENRSASESEARVICEPAAGGNAYRCRVGDQDLSRVVLYNGGGRATADASEELKTAEQQARSQRTGIWAGGDDDDDD